MPIGRRPVLTASGGSLMFPNATASGAVRAGAAVAIVDIAGSPRIVECSASSNGESFQGFAVAAVADGDPVSILTVRGSQIAPVVSGGGPLTPGSLVFLSSSVGEVSQTSPASGLVLRVGQAVTATTMILNTDSRVLRP